MSKAPSPPAGGVCVRMYRTGLGDCFLLSFRGEEERVHHMLIDCGNFYGTKGGKKRMQDVVADIRQATGGRIDVIVASHEHFDHLSGFNFARDEFGPEKIEVGEVWLAWTEDPNHPLGRKIRKERGVALAGIQGALDKLAVGDPAAAKRVQGVLDFFGVEGKSTTKDALDFVKQLTAAPRYCRPGEILEIPDLADVRIYVLGPPEDERLLLRAAPSKTGSEVYEQDFALGPEASFLIGARFGGKVPLTDADREALNLSFPFDSHQCVSPAEAKADPFFSGRYGFDDAHPESWRRIETDWLETAGQIALALDNATNNTSLALAIEFVSSGRVLLFPADAQVGNWLSWEDLSWELHGDENPVTVDDLLGRTVLYKVGHHGSHNATMRERGLELMTHADLVAMIPVDQNFAEDAPRRWRMPFEPLLKRLEEKTRGRVLRADRGLSVAITAADNADAEAFRSNVTVEDLYIQYMINPKGGEGGAASPRRTPNAAPPRTRRKRRATFGVTSRTWTTAEVSQRVSEIVCEIDSRWDPGEITNSIEFAKHLKWDTVAKRKLRVPVEESFEVEVDALEVENTKTVGDLSTLVQERLHAQQRLA